MKRISTWQDASDMADMIENAINTVLQIEARYHDDGQSHWLGGISTSPFTYDDVPAPCVRAAFEHLKNARDALAKAEHEMRMGAIADAKGEPALKRRVVNCMGEKIQI